MPLLLMLALSCAPKAQVRALQAENAALHAQLQGQQMAMEAERAQAAAAIGELNALSAELAECKSGAQDRQVVTTKPVDEQAAAELYRRANEAINDGRTDEARSLFEELLRDHPNSRSARNSQRSLTELAVIGQPAPPLTIDRWLQGDPAGWGRVTLVVFFEVWCPHCKREVPRLQERYEELSGRGLDIYAFTKLTRSSTEESTRELMEANALTFPVAVETGELTTAFAVSGIPAAALVKDGEIVWRGHPARLDWDWVASLL